ncbi:UNVERIFIED_ORG: hypothetical protein B2H93_04635 [Clostridium botulinum]
MKLKDIKDLDYQGALRGYISETEEYMTNIKNYVDNFEIDSILEDFKKQYDFKKCVSIATFIKSLEEKVQGYENIKSGKIYEILYSHGVTYFDETLNKKRIKQEFLDKDYFLEKAYVPLKGKDAGIRTIKSVITEKGQNWLLYKLKEFNYIK